MVECESKYEEIINGGALDESDWCFDAQHRLQKGSDGLWMRFGKTPGPTLMQQIFAFQFNPCVSFFAVAVLFSLVGFCCIKPGEFCSETIEVYDFSTAAGTFQATKTKPQPAAASFSNGMNTELKLLVGAVKTDLVGVTAGTTSKVFQANLDVVGKTMTHNIHGASNLQAVAITTKSIFQDVECFMPKKEFDDWMKWVTRCFTWLYIVTQDIWIVFAVYLFFSKYGKIKLGRDQDEPEFTYFAWFSMLFTCGVATGLFFFAVTEPQWYYLTAWNNDGTYQRNRWTYSGVYVDAAGAATGVYNTPNKRAQEAMTVTWYHWGLHGWVCYCLLGVLLAFLHFRKGLPMTIKTCFYPLIGTRIYGFVGDLLDTISVVATTMGVCTSLGLGVMQLNTGLEMLNGDQHWMGEGYYNSFNFNKWSNRMDDLKKLWNSWDQSTKASKPWGSTNDATTIATAGSVASLEAQNNQQMLMIWIITASATCSVMLGLKNGIKQLALLCLGLGQFVIFYVWMMDDTWFLTNLFVQTLGDYVAQLPALGFHTSAVDQGEINNPYGEYSTWQNGWTIFYWGWWIAWAPFVGVFLARVGKGRTVREFVFCTLFSACIYNFVFMTILGGAGLKMQMVAEKHKVGTADGGGCSASKLVTMPNTDDNYITVSYKENVCRAVATRKYTGETEYFCSTVTNLACSMAQDGTRPLFEVMNQYADVAKGMTVILLITITLYFVASSDSGSMVDDMMTANGLPEPCLCQRLFWALTEGAAASALLSVGKYIGAVDGGLRALRSASICVGLPYTFLICFMCVALYRALQYEVGDRKWMKDGFNSCIIDVGITVYTCGESLDNGQATTVFNGQRGQVDVRKIGNLMLYGVCPLLPIFSIQDGLNKRRGTPRVSMAQKVVAVSCMVMFFTWFLFQFLDYLPISKNAQEWGSVMGDQNSKAGNSRYYLSNRWGYYHEWANKDSERKAGDAVKWNEWVQGEHDKTQERPITVTVAGVSKKVGVGERFAQNYRIAVVGWFFFFLFITFLTSLRSDIRMIMQIPGTLMEDFLVCCFWPFALWQMKDHLDNAPDTLEARMKEL